MSNITELNELLGYTVLRLGSAEVTLGHMALAIGLLFAALLVLLIWASLRASRVQAIRDALATEQRRESEAKLAQLVASQNELTGRMQSMGEMFAKRIEDMSGRVGQSISETTRNTQESLAKLQERLAVIDTAQNNITNLAGQVVELQSILSNKQTRGAFGEGRMQQIVQDGLPIGAYEFQFTLINGARPDCIIHMPNDTPPLVVDAKFPLESWHAIRQSETPDQAKSAAQSFRRDVEVHIKAISEKYLVKGETQDTAFMFVPSESIFAEIHENFEALIQKAHRARVVIVSPSLLMLSIQVMQSVLKDVRMREQAHLIQREIVRLMEDVGRLDDRVHKLDTHFRQAQKDVEMIMTSSDKLSKRGSKIVDLDFEDQAVEAHSAPRLKAVDR